MAICATAGAGVLAACATAAPRKHHGSAASGAKTVAILAPELSNNTYSAAWGKKMSQLAAADHVTLKVYNAGYSVATQSTQADAAFAQHPNAVIYWPASPSGARALLLQAKQDNIPVDIENSGLSTAQAPHSLYHAFTGPSNYAMGVDDANLLKKALGGHGDIAVIQGQPANTTNTERIAGLMAQLKKVAPGIKVARQQARLLGSVRSGDRCGRVPQCDRKQVARFLRK